MTTYSQRLEYYNRYQRRPQTKEADFWQAAGNLVQNGVQKGKELYQNVREGADKLDWSGENSVRPIEANAQPFTNEQLYQELISTLPPQAQAQQEKENPQHNIGRLLFIGTLDNTGQYRNMFGYIVQSQIVEHGGKPTAFFHSDFWNNLDPETQKTIQTALQDELQQQGATTAYGVLGTQPKREIAGDELQKALQEKIYNLGVKSGTESSGTPNTNSTPSATPQGATTGQNPSMWRYMLPALAVGGPAALLGGLGGGRNLGLGILGAAGLGALAYGYARSNNWKGWEPVENFANTMNGWFGAGNQQNSSNTPAGTTPSPASTPAGTTPPQAGTPTSAPQNKGTAPAGSPTPAPQTAFNYRPRQNMSPTTFGRQYV